jgi:hypothetical protein
MPENTDPLPKGAVMVPALLMVPPIVLSLMVIPVLLRMATPFAVNVPVEVLITLPLTVEFWTLMQSMAEPLLTEATLTPTLLLVQAAAAGRASPRPTASATAELDNSSRPRLPRPWLPISIPLAMPNPAFAAVTAAADSDGGHKRLVCAQFISSGDRAAEQ